MPSNVRDPNRATRRTTGRPPIRRIAIAVVAFLVVGGAIGAAAILTAPSEQTPQGTANTSRPEPVRTTAPPEEPDELPAEAPETAPAGVLRLADPNWVVNVSTEAEIPTRALAAYAGADLYARAEYGCSVGWNTLAAIGFVESEHGTLQGGSIGADYVATPEIIGIALDGRSTAAIPDTDDGVLDGDTSWDRAVGPMQFIPETWAEWGTDGDGDGKADVHNIADASLTAARYLCQAHGTLGYAGAWIAAIHSYNSDPHYQDRVAEAAQYYGAYVGG